MTADTRNKVIDVNNTNKSKSEHKTSKPKRHHWNIIGENRDNPIKAIGKKTALFVSRITPNTKVEDFEIMVRKNFKEAECIALKSKMPDKYSSFKVIIDESSIEKAKNSNSWPDGAYVSKFFLKKLTRA